MSTSPSWLSKAARRSSGHAWSLGSLFVEYCEMEGRTLDDIAVDLGCDADTLSWLSLCRRPSTENFSDDVERIVERVPVSAVKLVEILRRVDAVKALRKRTAPEEDTDESLLLAARDRKDEEDS